MFVLAEASKVASADGSKGTAAVKIAREVKLNILFEIKTLKELYEEYYIYKKAQLRERECGKCQRQDANKRLLVKERQWPSTWTGEERMKRKNGRKRERKMTERRAT